MFKRIDSLHFWCNKILPLVYDDSLSYYETLCKLSAKLNEVINDVNDIPEYIAELLSEEKLKEILSTLLNQLEEQIASANEGDSETATADRNVGDMVWLNGLLYRAIKQIGNGDKYVVDSNIEKITIEELYDEIQLAFCDYVEVSSTNASKNINNGTWFWYKNKLCIATKDISQGTSFVDGTNYIEINVADILNTLQKNISDETNAREQADTLLQQNINNETTARQETDTLLKQSIDEIKTIYANVKDYGAIGNGIIDDTLAIQNCIDNNQSIYIPNGVYKVTSTITLGTGKRINGSGTYHFDNLSLENGTVISGEVSTDVPVIKVIEGAQHFEIGNLTIKRSSTPVIGGSGLQVNNCNFGKIHNVECYNHYYGIELHSTGFSQLDDCFTHDNYNHGVFIENNSNSGAMQWQITRCLSQQNDGCGFMFHTVTNSYNHATLGTLTQLNTYANKQSGIRFEGVEGTGLNGIRLYDSFFGEDGEHEIYINTYSNSTNEISNVYVEACGTSNCGRGGSTPAPNTGCGMFITETSYSTKIDNSVFISNSGHGISTRCQHLAVRGCEVRGNGFNKVSPIIGISADIGELICVNNTITGHEYCGVLLGEDKNHMLVGNYLLGNGNASYRYSTTMTKIIVGNNQEYIAG